MNKIDFKIILLGIGCLMTFVLVNDFFRKKLSDLEFKYYGLAAIVLLVIVWFLFFKKAINKNKQKPFLIFTFLFSACSILFYYILK
ncbi:MAG: hypothetical protein K2X37_01425 [Chitinophagaceae bacterium]|nr:hypothetical protein [Chitinophagaceae bacterium]